MTVHVPANSGPTPTKRSLPQLKITSWLWRLRVHRDSKRSRTAVPQILQGSVSDANCRASYSGNQHGTMNAQKKNEPFAQRQVVAFPLRLVIGLMVLSAAFVLLLAAYSGSPQSSASSATEKNPDSSTQKNTEDASVASLTSAVGGFAPTVAAEVPAPSSGPDGMVWIPGGELSMGSDADSESLCSLPGVTRDALPKHRVAVDGFRMDATEVTNSQYAQFVEATGYVMVAGQKPTPEEFPTAPPENLIAGSTVFTPTLQRVALNNYFQWWSYVAGADWRQPTGPENDFTGRVSCGRTRYGGRWIQRHRASEAVCSKSIWTV